ncbi:MAG TPA: hypothetical protein VFX49_13695 [Chloroflexota bacterium]|nr:hypothetical protein [Chloroflexota bacterium]
MAAVLGATGALGVSGIAAAGETWCDIDPPVAILTPGGNLAVVYVVTSGPPLLLANLLAPAITYEVKPAESGDATRVAMDVTVKDPVAPDGHQNVRSEVWTGPARTGRLLSAAEGLSGAPMRHHFKLDVA